MTLCPSQGSWELPDLNAVFGHQRQQGGRYPPDARSHELPLYFMHFRTPADEMLDPEGVRMPEDTVADAALRAARDCMAHDLRAGRIDLTSRIDVHNEAGEIVHTLLFADAVEIVPA
jgi:hypothetical protein